MLTCLHEVLQLHKVLQLHSSCWSPVHTSRLGEVSLRNCQPAISLGFSDSTAYKVVRYLGLRKNAESLMLSPPHPYRSRAVRWWGRLMLLVDLTYTTFYIPITLVLYERYNVLMATEAT